MADFTLPARPKRRTSQAPTLPISALPGRGDQSQSGVEGFLTRLPAGMGAGTTNYQAGIDQSRGGQLAAGLPEVQDQVATAQAQSLQEHKAYREGLQATQQQVDTRNKDLKLVENLLIATDPGTDKAVRKFMLQGISNAVGVDPKGEYSQGLQKMVLGMAPEGLEALRSSFSDDIRNSPPGAIHAKLGAMFSGDIPVENVIGQVKEHQEARADAARGLTHPGVPLTSGTTPDIAGAETTAELAGGAGAAPAAAPPSAGQRQQIIQAAGLSDAPTATTPPQEAAPPPEEAAVAAPPPDIPLPEAIDPQDLAPGTPAPAAPVETPEVTPPPPAAPPPAAAAPPLSDAPTATTPPTAATPPPDTGKITVTPEMRQAAEQAGDKLLLKAFDLLDQRNAVLDSAAIHRGGPPPVAGAPPATAKGSPSGASFFPSTQTLPYKGPPIDPNKAPPPEPEPGVPATAEDAKRVIAQATQSVLDALPADPITGNKPGDVFRVQDDGRVVTKEATADMPTKTAAGAITTESQPAGPKPSDPMPNTWIKDHNTYARQNQLPKTENLRYVEEKDRAPHEQELYPGLKGGLSGVNPDPAARTTAGDIAMAYPNVSNTKEYATELAKIRATRDAAFTNLSAPAFNLLDLVNNRGGNQTIGGFGPVTKGNVSELAERAKALFGIDSQEFNSNMALYKDRATNIANTIEGLDPKQRSDLSVAIQANAALLVNGILKAQNPDGKYSDKDREAAQSQVASMLNSTSQLNVLIANQLELGMKSANQGFATATGSSEMDLRGVPRAERDRFLTVWGQLPDDKKAIVNPEFIKQLVATNRQEDDRKAGKPPRENEYIVSRGGNRPEDYEAAKQRESHVVEGRKVSEEGRQVRSAEIAEERLQMSKDQVTENNRRYEETKARQAQQDAAHAQEKMAAAFSRIGAMIAGSVRGIGGGGGSGISAGGEDSSAFRIAPMPQRAAPRVAPATPITRYGGPIKKQ